MAQFSLGVVVGAMLFPLIFGIVVFWATRPYARRFDEY